MFVQIMGASGSGKTSLLRAIGGLWTAGKGRIKRHFINVFEGETNGAAKSIVEDNMHKGGEPRKDAEVLVSSEDRTDGNNKEAKLDPGAGLKELEKERLDNQTIKESLDECEQIFFLPQRPYMVLGSLRQQILYPTWAEQTVSILENSESTSGKGKSLLKNSYILSASFHLL
jgi:ABC-type glutathione transport system ATPase component